MRSVICDSSLEKFFQQLAESEKFAIGLIIGQTVKNGKDYIIHFAKSFNIPNSEAAKSFDEISLIDNSQLAEHALNTTRIVSNIMFPSAGSYVTIFFSVRSVAVSIFLDCL
jgi:hypothetical protein